MTADLRSAQEVSLDDIASFNVWRLAWRVSQHRRKEFWVGALLFIYFFIAPALTGFALSRGYTALADGRSADTYKWAAVVALSEVLRMISVHYGALVWTRVWAHMESLLRANMLVAQLASGGPEAGQPVGSAGRAITHFRDDTDDVAEFVDNVLDTSGGILFAAISGFILASADLPATLILLVPIVAVVIVTKALDSKIKVYRVADREATEEVTGLLGDIMAAATTVKVNDASESSLARLQVVVDRRRDTAIRDRVLDEGVQAFSAGAADIGLGLVLLISAGGIASGAFDLGTLALFVAYLGWLSFFPKMLGRVLSRRKQVAVSFDRMRKLVADENVDNTVRPRHVPIDPADDRSRPEDARPERVRLDRLTVRELAVSYPGENGSEPIVDGVSFEVRRGQFVVLTGPVGSGKSTMLRALLGLTWQAEVGGTVAWNGEVLTDRAAFLIPPNAAFLPQVPQLISDSVRDNVGLGPVGAEALATSLRLAAIDADIAEMPESTDTMIGPRGLRLSGGQRQRLATARALVHAPELVVLDDVSSALDVETELTLWKNLADAGMTVIAVSHRAVAFERADQILRLDRGHLVGS
ncbi:MAG: ABC transporter ATP-binding protein [Acidimicrobiia bacterium]|nr:ABC transporter ATP-binding protein [Acidimicrobiia bacterium]